MLFHHKTFQKKIVLLLGVVVVFTEQINEKKTLFRIWRQK